MENITLTRAELYALVWKEPMLTLSKKYDISDVGLRKMCVRLEMPTPQAGHWQRIRFGKKPNRIKLPKSIHDGEIITINFRTENEDKENLTTSLRTLRSEIRNDRRVSLIISERLTKPDKLVLVAKGKLVDVDHYGRFKGMCMGDRNTLDIRVSPKLVSRALRFMDALIKALRSRGHNVVVGTEGYKIATYAVVNKQEIRIYLRERVKQTLVSNGSWNSAEYSPSGILSFKIEGGGNREWKDGNSLIEEFFLDILATLELNGEKLRINEIESQKQHAIWEAKEKIRKEVEARKKLELEDFIDLLGKFNRWQQARQLREYLEKVELLAKVNDKLSEDFQSWLNRAREKADWYDPLIEREDEWLIDVDRKTCVAKLIDIIKTPNIKTMAEYEIGVSNLQAIGLPEMIYKYREALNDYHESILSEQKVYFAPPKSFEDKLDCKIPIRYDLLTDDDIYDKYYNDLRKQHPEWDLLHLRNEAVIWTNKGIMRDKEHLEEIEADYWKEFNERFGVLSLTAEPANADMWNKYAGGFSGFCVGFDPKIMFQQLGGGGIVDYMDVLPIIKPFDPHHVIHIKQTFSKLTKWSFEKEYRTHKFWPTKATVDDRCVKINSEAFVVLIFGEKTRPDIIKRLSGFAKNINSAIKFKMASKSSGAVTLSEFNPI